MTGAAVCAVALAGSLAGCGSATGSASGGSSASGSSTASPTTTTTPAQPKVSLSFTVMNGVVAKRVHWTLQCDPPGGSEPDAAAACRPLLRLKQPFEPLSKRINCPMIIASDRQILVTGTWFGAKVHRVITDGGCDLALFGTLTQGLH